MRLIHHYCFKLRHKAGRRYEYLFLEDILNNSIQNLIEQYEEYIKYSAVVIPSTPGWHIPEACDIFTKEGTSSNF